MGLYGRPPLALAGFLVLNERGHTRQTDPTHRHKVTDATDHPSHAGVVNTKLSKMMLQHGTPIITDMNSVGGRDRP